MFNQLGLIGCGLMGGSFALALKKAGLVRRVVGYSKSPSTVEKARRLGVIDVAAESALLAVSGSDIVIIAVLGGGYVLIGGLKSVMITDTIQGVVLFSAGAA